MKERQRERKLEQVTELACRRDRGAGGTRRQVAEEHARSRGPIVLDAVAEHALREEVCLRPGAIDAELVALQIGRAETGVEARLRVGILERRAEHGLTSPAVFRTDRAAHAVVIIARRDAVERARADAAVDEHVDREWIRRRRDRQSGQRALHHALFRIGERDRNDARTRLGAEQVEPVEHRGDEGVRCDDAEITLRGKGRRCVQTIVDIGADPGEGRRREVEAIDVIEVLGLQLRVAEAGQRARAQDS